MSVSSDGVKAVGAVEPVVVEHMSPVFVAGSAVRAVRSGDEVWVPLNEAHRVERELSEVRGLLTTARVDATTAQDATRAAEARERAAQSVVARLEQEDRDRNAAACEWADENSLCDQFERFCEAYGWQGRTRTFDVTVRVTADVVVQVEAPRGSRGDDLRERVEEDEVRDQVRVGQYDVVSHEVYDYDEV